MIDQLEIVGFKCFNNETLNVAPLTLLSGLNSSGKSSFIQALRLLKEGGALAGYGSLADLKSRAHASFKICARKDNVHFGLEYTGSGQLNNLNKKVAFFPPLFSFISASRFGPQSSLPIYPGDNLLSVGERGEYVIDFFERNYELSGLSPMLRMAGPETSSVRQNITAWLNVISPGVTFDTKIDRMADMGRTEYGGFRASNVGFGLSYTLPIIVNILIYSALIESNKHNSAIILIENPEAHLHPSGQTKIGEMLARAAACGIQIIVETHSDHLLNGVRLAVKDGLLRAKDSVFYYFAHNFEEDYTSIETPTIDEFGMFDEWPNGFFDESEKNLGRLL
ncbi:MAG: DUF3696 domain-containing protein [Proteobacteria bacterium]|nr:DUF3696 domain-containing protein [Pseudomonadota bacterium]MBU1649280.1 DUF3696 domain-containing protein [Pseudomonadota bacterium]